MPPYDEYRHHNHHHHHHSGRPIVEVDIIEPMRRPSPPRSIVEVDIVSSNPYAQQYQQPYLQQRPIIEVDLYEGRRQPPTPQYPAVVMVPQRYGPAPPEHYDNRP